MAFDLRAILRLDDQFSSPMARIERRTKQLQRTMNQLSSSTSSAERNHSRLSSSVSKATSGLGSLKSAVLGVAAAYASVEGAKKIFESTVGAAMEREVSAITIDTMFDTKRASKDYQAMMKKMALDSPVLSYNDMAGGSKRLLSLTRDSKVLAKSWKNVEKLQAFAPDKSTDDAIRGIAELASGDIVSLKEVFNLDKKQLNALKGLSFEDQVTGLEKMLTGMKITDKLIDKVGNTTFAKLNQVKEKFADIFATMGGPSLDVLKNFFNNILLRLDNPNDAQRFANIGAHWIKNILNGLSTSVIKIYDWFTSLTSSEEWKSKTTLFSKVEFVLGDVYQNFLKWLDGGGKEKINKVTSDLIQLLIGGIEASSAVIGPVANKLGAAIGKGIYDGVKDALGDSWILQYMNNPNKFIQNTVKSKLAKFAFEKFANDYGEGGKNSKKPKKHNGGLSYVPYNGYQASLHKGEAVLPRGEATNYRSGKTGGASINLTVNYTGDAPINRIQMQKFADFLADEIQAAGGAGA